MATADDAMRVLARHGRSFHWASSFLGHKHARDAAILYAFCRHADDLVDEHPPDVARVGMTELRRQLHTADCDAAAVHGSVREFVALTQRHNIDLDIVDALLDTLEQDIGPVRLGTLDQLLRYAYGVASTVGLMMCDVVGCAAPRARAFAIDLGIGMQLTNVARDVLEDARRGRVYLPLPGGVDAAAIESNAPGARDTALEHVHEVLRLAERYYRSAEWGLRYLPWRVRAAIAVASRVYEGIGAVIRRRGHGYWNARCSTGTAGKLWHTHRAIGALVLQPRYWAWWPGETHDPRLHAPLRGLPGVSVS